MNRVGRACRSYLAVAFGLAAIATLTGCGGQANIVSAASSTPTAAHFTVAPSVINFGDVTVGTQATQNVSLANSGTTAITVSQANVTGSGFSLASSAPALPIVVDAGQTVSIAVVFAPTTATTDDGSLTIATSDSSSALAVSLHGNGRPNRGPLVANPTSLSFGSVTVGQSSTLSVAVTNTGTATATISSAAVTGAGMSLASNTPAFPLSAAGQSVSFGVVFAPQTATSVTGALTITSNAAVSTLAVGLSGTGASAPVKGPLTANPTSLSFGSVTVGQSSTLSVAVTNTGTATATISSAAVTGAGMSLASNTPAFPLSVAAGQSVSFGVVFAPQTATSVTGALTITSNAAVSTLAVGLSGTGASAPVKGPLTANPTSLSFGSVTVGQSSTLSVAVTNTGTATATISSAAVTGAGMSLASNTPAFPLSVAAGQSVSFGVVFAPQASGSITGSLTIASDATNASLSVGLSGTGAKQHSVALTWQASASPVNGYNVYRSQVSGGPYTLVSTTLLTTASFTDTTVLDGQTYYYVVTGVDSQGVESAYSNQVQVTIPSF